MDTNYVSGFIYNSKIEKILLRNTSSSTNVSYSLFSGKGSHNTEGKITFQKIISDELGILIPQELIFAVYEYERQDNKSMNYIFYADICALPEEEQSKIDSSLTWFTFKQITKLKFHPQTSHDIIIGQRVIRAKDAQSS